MAHRHFVQSTAERLLAVLPPLILSYIFAMSSADTAAAKKAAGQLQQDQADLHSSQDLKQTGHTEFQQGTGMQNADKETGASG